MAKPIETPYVIMRTGDWEKVKALCEAHGFQKHEALKDLILWPLDAPFPLDSLLGDGENTGNVRMRILDQKPESEPISPPPPVDRTNTVSTKSNVRRIYRPEGNLGAPGEIDPETGQHTEYWILSDEERAKGFVRPVRRSYLHVGIRPKYPLRELTEEEHERYDKFGYLFYEKYPDGEGCLGRFWSEKMMNSGCGGSMTTMSQRIAETYARDPSFYGSTMCVHCGSHFPVEEFVWARTNERVGS